MPSSSGPNTVNDSIIFNYDIGDVANSYKGEPTTNLAADGGLGPIGIGLTDLGMENGWRKYALSGTWSGGGYPYSMYLSGVGFTGGVYYSTQAILKTNVPGKFNYFAADGINYVNVPMDNGGTVVQRTLPDGSSYVARVGFAYSPNTNQPGYLLTNPINGITFDPSTDFVYLKNFQVEQNTHCTQYTPSSRSSTQGLLDVSGVGNSIDISNASFDSNAQITFDGTNDYIEVTSNLGTLSQYTIEHISYKGSDNRMPIAFRSGPIFYHYADNSWYYTHGGAAGEYYYPKTKTINGWGHWVIVYTGSSVRIYRNGIYEGQQSTSGTANWTGGMRIGNYGYGGYPWNGQIAIVKMYNRALNDSEVINNYNQYKIRFNLS
jgi:hypothetical protein